PSALAAVRSVVGVAVSPEHHLPSTLIAASDARIELKLTPKFVEEAILKLYGKLSSPIGQADLVGLELDDIVAAMRPNDDGHGVVVRLKTAARSRAGVGGVDDAPVL